MSTGEWVEQSLWAKCRLLFIAAVTLAAVSGCTGPEQLLKARPASAEDADAVDEDSWEPFNRVMYQFNYGLDTLILHPISQGYRFMVPQEGRVMVSNVLENLYSPVVLGNSILQGDPQNSFATLWRFILNSTFGLGGLRDFAGNDVGLHNRPADFGETLAMYGVSSGPYVVLPLIGPSDVRDGLGRVVDVCMDPFTYAGYNVSIPKDAISIVDARSRNSALIDDVYANSIDPYETFRSAYMQKRQSDIHKAELSCQKALEQATGK